MSKPINRLILETNQWYAWEMMPGYSSGRYYSPILVNRIQPLNTGKNIVQLGFHNACYAEGVRNFDIKLQILFRGQDYILANLQDGEEQSSGRCAIIAEITIPWLLSHFPNIKNHHLMSCNERDVRLREIIDDFFYS